MKHDSQSPDPADVLASDLAHLHLVSPEKESVTPEKTTSEATDATLVENTEAKPSADLQRVIERHEARKFEWVLSLPYDARNLLESATKENRQGRRSSTANVADQASEDRKIYFGCNLLQHRARSGSDLSGQQRLIDTYTFVATPLGSRAQGSGEAATMVDTPQTPERVAPTKAGVQDNGCEASSALLGSALEVSPADRSRSRCSSVSRIEDTIEELDRFEDEFEEVHQMVRVDGVPSTGKTAAAAAAAAGENKKKTKSGPGAARAGAKPAVLGRAASVRKTGGATSGNGNGNASKRQSMTRPASLLPPKPPAKSSKPVTVPTFELPGDAVARRLKEQREKRLSMAAADPQGRAAASTPTPRKIHSTKPVTVPTFELPGEAISRRKREEHEAKLRQQEEEEKKRREFKARPIRASVAPSTMPRETATSRARLNRMSMIEGSKHTVVVQTSTANKRHSMMSTTTTSTMQSEQLSRGRESSVGPHSAASQTSRTGSTSTGSVSGLRSTVSSEEIQQQKQRGKQIYYQDSYLSIDRKQEKEERERLAKVARQEAAERSRMLSREWAEKQRQRMKKAMGMGKGGEKDA